MDVIGYALAQAIPAGHTTDSWTSKVTATNAGTAESNVTALADGTILLVGLNGSSVDTRLYDPAADTYTVKAAVPREHDRGAIGTIDGLVYLAGGNAGGSSHGDLHIYNPATNTWTTGAAMQARDSVGFAVVNGFLYVLGGSGYASILRYNPATNTWATLATALSGSYNIGIGVTVIGGLIYRSGGASAWNGAAMTTQHEVIDPVADTKTLKAPLTPAVRAHHVTLYESESAYAIVGGLDGNSSAINVTASYDVATNTWTADRATFPVANQWGQEAAVVGTETYVFGGTSSNYPARVYTPRIDTKPFRSRLLAYLASK